MKNRVKIMIIFLVVAPIACNGWQNLEDVEVEEMYDYEFENDIQISSVKEALDYVSTTIKYKKDPQNYWQLPEETYSSKSGDCEDFSLLLAFLCWTKLNIDDVFMVIIKVKEDIGIGEPVWVSDHAIVQINGIYYEPQNGNELTPSIEDDIIWKASYPEALWWAVNYHGLYTD